MLRHEVGTENYKNLVKEYAMLFLQYGYTISMPDRESLMVEKEGQIGAFTVREDGLVAGAFYPSLYKEELLTNFEEDKENHSLCNSRLGWFFYDEMMHGQAGGSGNHDFSMGEVEGMLRTYSK